MEDVIIVDGLKKNFRTPFRRKLVEAVRSATFAVHPGEIFGFLGPNGAGKTTTIKVLTGLIRPTAGTARILGGNPGDIKVMARLGYLPEQPYFYDYLKPEELLDIFGQIFGLSRSVRRKRIDSLLSRVGLDHARGRTLRKFSKGMIQRVGIAQALLNEPDLVILDEPLSGLDPMGRKEVIDIIASLKAQGRTVFFSSHILSDIERLCDRVVILDRGEIRAAGPLDELLAGGATEKEILVRGEADPDALADLPGVGRVDHVGNHVWRLVCGDARMDATLRAVLDCGFQVLAVTDHRMSLEELFLDRARGVEGPGKEAA